ncbi:hypothetical protein ACFWNB_41055, partial [Kitasatospora purpeofusca]
MSKNAAIRRSRPTAGAVGTAVLVLADSTTGVARAAESAGTGVQITAAHTSGSTPTWPGTYSCVGGVADTVTVRASDELGHTATGLAVITCLGSTTGAPIGGSVATGPLGLGGTWGDDVTITVTMRGLLGTALASARAALARDTSTRCPWPAPPPPARGEQAREPARGGGAPAAEPPPSTGDTARGLNK